MEEKKVKVSLFDKFLNTVENVGNKLPHPVLLFAELAFLVVIVSAICEAMGVSAVGTIISGGELTETTIKANSLFNGEGFAWMLSSAISNFTGYAPLGTVMGAMLGVGVAERSGLISAMLKRVVEVTPKSLICPVMVFLGVMSNVASDVGYVVLIPLGAMVFRAYGRHPMAGLAATFSGVSGGFSANLAIGTLDPLLQGISQEAATLIDPGYEVNIMGNYYFMFASTFVITLIGTFITDKVVEPRLGKFDGTLLGEEDASLRELSDLDRKALKNATIAFFVYVTLVVAACIPSDSFMRNANGEFLASPTSPLISGIIVIIALCFFIPGAVYGLTNKTYKNTAAVCDAMGKSMGTMGTFLSLAFVASQFIAYFGKTNLGTILAINGAALLQEMNVGLIPLMIVFVIFSAFINLFMGSASAKWNIMAPVFVPMFMLLGYSPELAQLAYRIGDSTTNLITPLMSYFAIILVYAQKYDKNAGIGTLTATMLPYSMGFLVFWTVLLVIWLSVGIPIGPGTSISYIMGT
ncbi:MAG: AbgT family transporter [Eubacteriales bacterium]